MNYTKPELKLQKFSTESYLEDVISAPGEEGGSNIIDDTNFGEIGHEILDNIFNFNNP